MSNGDKKGGFAPTQYFSKIWNMTLTLFLAWFVFNLVLAFSCWFIIRLTHYDVDPDKLKIAKWLTKDRVIDLEEVAPGIQTIRQVYRLDTDGDKFDEWVAYYAYDVSTKAQKGGDSGPYGAAVFDPDRCRPPTIVTYELSPYDQNYIGENLGIWGGQPPTMQDVNADGKLELVVKVGHDLSVFRWFDYTESCAGPSTGTQGYQVLGTFRGSGGVEIAKSGQIVVKDRGFFDRSQIAVERVYMPQGNNGSYLNPEGGGLYAPVEQGLDFAIGQPISVTQTYYPEKAVLAFYLSLGKDNAASKALLCPGVDLSVNKDSFGINLPRSRMVRALVQEIGYTPNVEDERLHRAREVSAVVIGVDKNGAADVTHSQRVIWTVSGVPKPGALPYNCEWCLDSYQVVQ